MQIYPGRFDDGASQWRHDLLCGGDHRQRQLTCVTFNIWFDDLQMAQRHQALLEIVRRCDPDVVALQEVTEPSLRRILSQDWVRQDYWCSDVLGDTFASYGVVMLSRIPPVRLTLTELPSVMDRKLLSAELSVNGQPLQVAGLHLESMSPYAEQRAQQLRQIFPLLKQTPHSVLMGDFNLCSTSVENEQLDLEFSDVWPALRDEPGWTEDTDINLMRLDVKQKTKHVRFDRVLLRSEGSAWRPSSIELLGTEPIGDSRIYPSDHFGLCARFEWEGDRIG